MFVAGPYTASYNDVDLGITEDGFDLDQTSFQESIRGDNMGSTHQDAVYRGANVFLSWVSQEWNIDEAANVFWPWAAWGTIGQVGRLHTAVATDMVLSAVAGTNANTAGPGTLTAGLAILAADFDVKHILSTRHRRTPIRHQLYPQGSDAATATWFYSS